MNDFTSALDSIVTMSPIPLLAVLLCGVPAWAGLETEWAYTRIANTLDGLPCLTDCINGQCLVDWPGHSKACVAQRTPSPLYHTAQMNDKTNKVCLSKCGSFGYHYDWCVTQTKARGEWKWDYCNPMVEHQSDSMMHSAAYRSVYKRQCIKPRTPNEPYCAMRDKTDYYSCFVEADSWEFCAPPATLR